MQDLVKFILSKGRIETETKTIGDLKKADFTVREITSNGRKYVQFLHSSGVGMVVLGITLEEAKDNVKVKGFTTSSKGDDGKVKESNFLVPA